MVQRELLLVIRYFLALHTTAPVGKQPRWEEGDLLCSLEHVLALSEPHPLENLQLRHQAPCCHMPQGHPSPQRELLKWPRGQRQAGITARHCSSLPQWFTACSLSWSHLLFSFLLLSLSYQLSVCLSLSVPAAPPPCPLLFARLEGGVEQGVCV